MTARFARHASPAFNDWMEESVADLTRDVRNALGDELVALILGGGYARGEGGVVRRQDREHPYNDLDFVVVLRTRLNDLADRLRPISHKYEKVFGIDVDFSRPLTVEDVRHWPHWLMWTDLLREHRVLWGDPQVLKANAPAQLHSSPPLIEATRLLLNRGAGLLWSMRIRRKLESAPDSDFVRRNVHKCLLSMGDSFIIAHGKHQARYEGRDLILEALEVSDATAKGLQLLPRYREALAFRLEPGDAQPEAFPLPDLESIADLWGTVWLYTETRRSGVSFNTTSAYSAWPGIREADQNSPRQWPRNAIRNLQARRLSLKYPREFLFRELPRLLIDERSPSDQWNARSASFLALWRRFN